MISFEKYYKHKIKTIEYYHHFLNKYENNSDVLNIYSQFVEHVILDKNLSNIIKSKIETIDNEDNKSGYSGTSLGGNNQDIYINENFNFNVKTSKLIYKILFFCIFSIILMIIAYFVLKQTIFYANFDNQMYLISNF